MGRSIYIMHHKAQLPAFVCTPLLVGSSWLLPVGTWMKQGRIPAAWIAKIAFEFTWNTSQELCLYCFVIKDAEGIQQGCVGILLGRNHPSFPSTANSSCFIRASCFQIPIFKLPYQNVRIIRGNCLFIAIHVLCSVRDGFWLLLSVCCVLLARCWSLHWRLFLAGVVQGSRVVTLQMGPCWVPWAESWLGRKCGRLWEIPSTVWAETEQLLIRAWSLIWDEASRNPQAGSVLSDICVMNTSGISCKQRGLGWEHSDTAYRSGFIPPSLFLGGRGAACLHGHAPTLPLWATNREQAGKGWHKRHPGPGWASMVLPENVSPSRGWGSLALALGQQQQALLPACCGEHEAQMVQLEFEQNVLKAFFSNSQF